MSDSPDKKDRKFLAAGIGVGVAIGCGIGAALGNLAFGIGPGVAIGVVIGALMSKRRHLIFAFDVHDDSIRQGIPECAVESRPDPQAVKRL